MELLMCSSGYNVDYTNNKVIFRKFSGGGTEQNYLLKPDEKIENLNIVIKGKNNKIILEEDLLLTAPSKITIYGDNNLVVIGRSKFGFNFNILLPANGSEPCHDRVVSIGRGCYIGQAYIMVGNDNHKVTIGDNCFISDNVTIRTIDGHTILNSKDMTIQNMDGGDIFIGEHVWIGSGVRIMKNVSIACNTIVGAGAIVTKKFNEDGVVLGGIPAKIIRRNITWDHRAIKRYLKEI